MLWQTLGLIKRRGVARTEPRRCLLRRAELAEIRAKLAQQRASRGAGVGAVERQAEGQPAGSGLASG